MDHVNLLIAIMHTIRYATDIAIVCIVKIVITDSSLPTVASDDDFWTLLLRFEILRRNTRVIFLNYLRFDFNSEIGSDRYSRRFAFVRIELLNVVGIGFVAKVS